MEIRNIAHRGLRRLYTEDDPKGLAPDTVDKLRKMLAFLQDMRSASELGTIPVWKAHRLTGDRRGAWSLYVTRNRRLTFWIDGDNALRDLNIEDYH